MRSPSVEELWNNLHIKQGRSGKASEKAYEILQSIDTKNFTNQAEAKDHGEYARVAEVAGLAAARKTPLWVRAKKHLLRALDVTSKNYPLGTTVDEANLKGNYWETVYGGQSAQLTCLRDVLHLAQFLTKLVPSDELNSFLGGINELLFKLSDEKQGECFALIFLTEEAPYERAKAAYAEFSDKFGLQKPEIDKNQVITVTSRFLSRAVSEKDFAQVEECQGLLWSCLKTEPSLRVFTVLELVKNLAKVYANELLERKYETWSKKANKDIVLQDKIKQLLSLAFVGLGNDRSEKIST